MKKTKVVRTGKTVNFTTDGEDVVRVDSFCLLGSIINIRESSSEETFGRTRTKVFEKIFKCNNLSLQTKIRTVQAVVFSVVLYGCESWTGKILMPLNFGVGENF